MTDVEKLLADAICDLGIRRSVTLSTGEVITVSIVDRPWLAEQTGEVQSKKHIWSTIYARAADVATPASVSTITEVDSGKWHQVHSLNPTTQTGFVSWDCFSQR